MTLEERFWAKVERAESGCWMWRGGHNGKGYGRFYVPPRLQYAHRVSYEMVNGPIPDGLIIDHLCRTPACVNPAHLEPVTHSVNSLRGEHHNEYRIKPQCPAGHPYAGDNLYVDPSGKRCCRICVRASGDRWRAKQATR